MRHVMLHGLGKLAVDQGLATSLQIERALMHQAANPGARLGEILVERQVLSPAQLDTLLTLQRATATPTNGRAVPADD